MNADPPLCGCSSRQSRPSTPPSSRSGQRPSWAHRRAPRSGPESWHRRLSGKSRSRVMKMTLSSRVGQRSYAEASRLRLLPIQCSDFSAATPTHALAQTISFKQSWDSTSDQTQIQAFPPPLGPLLKQAWGSSPPLHPPAALASPAPQPSCWAAQAGRARSCRGAAGCASCLGASPSW